MEKVTPRQLEVLVNIFLGEGWNQYRTTTEDALTKAPPEGMPPWGVHEAWKSCRHTGGASYRMKTGMADKGLLDMKLYSSGRSRPTNVITAAGLEALRLAYPSLPDIDARLEERKAFEAERKAQEKAASQEREARRLERAAKLQEERAERMRAVLQDFKVQHQLTDDQLHKMWMRVTDEEVIYIF